jgi:hypothetical protein
VVGGYENTLPNRKNATVNHQLGVCIATKSEKFGFGPKISPYEKVVAGNRKRKASELEESNLTHKRAG